MTVFKSRYEGSRWRFAEMMMICSLIAVVAPTTPAAADSNGVGPPDNGWLADDKDHDWCFRSSFPATWYPTARTRHSVLSTATTFDGGTEEACLDNTDVKWADK